ncbi:pentapeptide repeat-containing protein [Catellatospora bangladeshensis]|uniref:Pentapeptide repeat-containing protein n=1 Tax=Catellatospora bangladeshensis TaxID=310355 RepID=A0A8J3JWG3_9ACTN|nr:pentapeptide repeat-containing protein [Catellatospora bangladeshensis]GIF84949.1 hypothetical protein Cba03nite_62980 [Catellatospora bangladeshensis]
MLNDEALAGRWLAAGGPELQTEVLRRLRMGERLDGLPLDRVDGRWDLRGLGAPEPRGVDADPAEPAGPQSGPITFTFEFATVAATLEFQRARLCDLDLRGAHLPRLRLFGCVIDNSLFDGAYCVGLRMWATDVMDSSFLAAELGRSSVGGWYANRANKLRNVDFRHADLSRLGCGVASFTDVDFSHAQLECTNFWQASLIRCRFAGVLREVVFDGRVLEPERDLAPNPMLDVDMAGVTAFDDVDFRGVNFDRVTLPDHPALVVVRGVHRVEAGLVRLDGRDDHAAQEARGRLQHLRKFMGQAGGADQALVDLRTLIDPEAALLLRMLLV